MSPSVEKIIEQTLALKPDDRFSSASDMAEALFASLHEITDRAPQDILTRFMANPASLTTIAIGLPTGMKHPEKSTPAGKKHWWLAVSERVALCGGDNRFARGRYVEMIGLLLRKNVLLIHLTFLKVTDLFLRCR